GDVEHIGKKLALDVAQPKLPQRFGARLDKAHLAPKVSRRTAEAATSVAKPGAVPSAPAALAFAHTERTRIGHALTRHRWTHSLESGRRTSGDERALSLGTRPQRNRVFAGLGREHALQSEQIDFLGYFRRFWLGCGRLSSRRRGGALLTFWCRLLR